MLEAKHVSVAYGKIKILDDVSFRADKGDWLMIVGPNGAGKSTMIDAVSRGVDYEGSILLDGQDIRHISARQRARNMGVLRQNHFVSYAFTVGEVVRMGRYARGGLFMQERGGEEQVERALEMTGLRDIEQQSVLTLSGGELQRTFIAQLFAQDPKLLLLDEPSNHLDLVYQQQIFELISRWIRETGNTVISVVHDLSLARKYGTHALMLHKGRVKGSGEARKVLTRERLAEVYEIDVYSWMQEMLSQWEEQEK